MNSEDFTILQRLFRVIFDGQLRGELLLHQVAKLADQLRSEVHDTSETPRLVSSHGVGAQAEIELAELIGAKPSEARTTPKTCRAAQTADQAISAAPSPDKQAPPPSDLPSRLPAGTGTSPKRTYHSHTPGSQSKTSTTPIADSREAQEDEIYLHALLDSLRKAAADMNQKTRSDAVSESADPRKCPQPGHLCPTISQTEYSKTGIKTSYSDGGILYEYPNSGLVAIDPSGIPLPARALSSFRRPHEPILTFPKPGAQ